MKKLVVTLVMDQYGEITNGTTVTARRLAEKLIERGHTVKIVTSSDIKADNIYVVKPVTLPIVKQIVASQGMQFAKPNKKVLREAFEGSDIVHFLMPFMISNAGKKIADEMKIATTTAFHVQPENITYTLGIGKSKLTNNFIYRFFRKFFNKFDHIHCPSEMIKNELSIRNYKAKLHVISNGIVSYFQPKEVNKPEELKDKFLIMMTARLSKEKRQDVLINAVAKSKYKDKIQLIFCGKGPWKKYLTKLDNKISTNKSIFKFCSQEELLNTINYCDLYVHSSDIDIEAIGCMEAFSCGLVPIISDNKLVATKQFALSEHCLFKSGNSTDLANKIDYFIEHPEEVKELKTKYIESAKQYQIEKCIDKMEKMFYEAIEDNKKKIKAEKSEITQETLFSSVNKESKPKEQTKTEELEAKVTYDR